MIGVYLSPFDFDYDVQALIRSFYPREKLKLAAWDGGDIVPDSDEAMTVAVEMKDESVTALLFQRGSLLGSSAEMPKKEAGGSWHRDADKSENSFRTKYKNIVKRVIFNACADFGIDTDACPKQVPAWGTMTGVRPTKIAMKYAESGMDLAEAEAVLQKEYRCSGEKARLILKIADKEKSLLEQAAYEGGYSLYIGIPFCPTTCLYCSFTSYPVEKYRGLMEEYLSALKKEIVQMAEVMGEKPLTTVYFGGGTPTSLEAGQLEGLLEAVKCAFDFTYVQEFTVEAGRPDSITEEKLQVLKKHGVTRISVNPQTMKEETLECIGRRHTAEQAKEAFLLARKAGFDNINMDLIIGLPGETPEDFARTLEEIGKLNPDSITIHSLVVKRASMLRSRREEGEFTGLVDMDAMSGLGRQFAEERGYEPYYMYRQKNKAGHAASSAQENIGYARKGKECMYNILIMEEKQSILALGAGASTKLYQKEQNRVERLENVKSVQDYINRIDEMIARKKSRISKDMERPDK